MTKLLPFDKTFLFLTKLLFFLSKIFILEQKISTSKVTIPK
jgi:hypothetical protein